MIEPTVGRIVHYFFATGAGAHAALLVGVHSERSINLAVFNDDGSHYPALEVPLLQDDDAPPAQGPWAAWMPFQKGQAMKLDAAESALLPRLEALEQLLTAGGPIHTLLDDLAKGTDGRLRDLTAWLEDRFASIEQRLPAPGGMANGATPIAPNPPVAESSGVGAQPQPDPAVAPQAQA